MPRAIGPALTPSKQVRDQGLPVSIASCRLTDQEWSKINPRLGLTTRELEVVSAILLGHSEPGVAVALGISTNTVHTHLGRVYRKLGVRSVAGLVLRVFAEYLDSNRR